MNVRKKLYNLGRSSLLIILAFLVVLSTSFVGDFEQARAAGDQANMSNVVLPRAGEEVGIWIDRFRIVMFNNVVKPAAGTEARRTFSVDADKGKGVGEFEYLNTEQPGRKLVVNFTNYSSEPTTGKYVYGDGTERVIRLAKPANSRIYGYYYEKNGEREIFMPRYISGLANCGTTTTGGVNGNISKDGTFTAGGGGEYGINGNTGNHDPKVFDLNTSDSKVVTAKQRKKSDCGGFKNDVSRYFPKDEADPTVLVRLAKDVTRDDVIEAANNVIKPWADAKVQTEALKEYFDSTPAGVTALNTCKAGAGGSYSSLSRDQLIDRLVAAEPGRDPFLDCMLRELSDDSEFLAALGAEDATSFQAAEGTGSASEDCPGGIPLISDLVCSIVRWTFDVIYDIFTGVINYLAEPPQNFTQSDSEFDRVISGLRSTANVIFLLAFIMVVFQYLTGFNIADAYFIKKFVPRLIIAVVLVQASGWIVKELSFFFYDLGISIQSILFYGSNISGNGFQLSGGAATLAAFGALGIGIIGLLLVVGLIMLIVLVITIIVLAIRYILILVLAMLSPIAFACFAIPQLEGITKKWLKMYVQTLMMYPMIMLFLAASTLVGRTLQDGGIILSMIGLIVQFIPFIILPFTFKFAGGLMGNIGAKVTNASKSLGKKAWSNSGTKADLDKFKGMRKQAKDNKSDERVARRLKGMEEGGTRRSRLARKGLMRGINDGQLGTYAGGFEDRVEKRKQEEANAAIASSVRPLTTQSEVKAKLKLEYDKAAAEGDIHKMTAAYAELVKNKAVDELDNIQVAAHATGDEAAIGNYNKVMASNYSGLKEVAPHLAGDISSGSDLQATRADNFAKLNTEQLASMNADSWQAFGRVNPSGAASARQSVIAAGGTIAAKLNPDAAAKIITGAATSSPTAFDASHPGGATSASTEDLKKAYESITKKISSTDHGLNASELANARDAANKIARELSGRP